MVWFGNVGCHGVKIVENTLGNHLKYPIIPPKKIPYNRKNCKFIPAENLVFAQNIGWDTKINQKNTKIVH